MSRAQRAGAVLAPAALCSAIALLVFVGRSTFSARGIPGSKLSSTRSPQTFS